ncbi:MAG: cation-translocating P-type ATPase [Candidatus Levybacteria bacterium]|nr:cation-translocating P-type ATPase [Candidatus Levybacteria bacterium]
MEKGLTTHDALQKLQQFGKNQVVTKKQYSPVSLFVSQFISTINLILIFGAAFSAVIGDSIDAFFILAVIIINGIIGFVQEYNAERSIEKLKTLITPTARVLRDEKEVQIPTTDIVPGDIVILVEGERIPADGRILSSHQLHVDESILTGESFPLIKAYRDTALSGTLITKGTGSLLVEKTGMDTRFGSIAKTLESVKADRTPLQKKLSTLGTIITLLVICISILIVSFGIFNHKPLTALIFVAVSIGISAIPEGLPAVVTIALAIGTKRMAKKNAIVRKMPVVETLGAIQVVLIDKTGTLTQNTMRVKNFWAVSESIMPLLFKACLLGNTATMIKNTKGEFDIVGDKTDGALLLWVNENHVDKEHLLATTTIVEEYVFDPEVKTITTIVKENKETHIFVRGAPETLLQQSELPKSEKDRITKHIEQFAKEGFRVIGFATKIEEHTQNLSREHVEEHLRFLGFVGIYDPPRKEAKQAVLEAQKAGVQTVMVTGDNELTALTIAKDVGLIDKTEDVVTGDQLDSLTDKDLEDVILRTRIFARTTPEHKLRLVTTFKRLGYIVGVTGDGVNDALALKRADVGVAMGASGTDVAKEASDIVLTDDNFATLIHAIEEGRTIYRNIVTSITYLLAGNLSELSLIFFASFFGFPTPLHPSQILWINIITDGLPALALAADVKDHRVLGENPRDPKEPLLNTQRLTTILVLGLGLGTLFLITFLLLHQKGAENYARTFVFNMIIGVHMIMVFVIRKRSIFHINKYLFLAVIISIIAQIFVNISPLFQTIFDLQHTY